ncbi:hypothetical protein [Streptomyces sp. CdTB01]|uniref:hypothetical protein n=1 Tax=Streptomyces sp. CdTB01 TaxID=1725411 RepID=UPI00073A855A|nr:hypothetical protein [Streptomyces sp. CdTB01]ALV30911.1 hypothetical protein AS200_01535 [Streptomyces sp. CdTB01]ALV38261.1 hypothetical protein AS200_44295 [Streptomyces sp. CdTB01]
MKYVDLDAQAGDLSGVLDPARYLSHLPSIRCDLPPGARAFATDTDHYDFRSRRCVKDLTLRAIRGAGGEDVEVEFRHNCCKHDQDLLIRYTAVTDIVIDPAVDDDRKTDLGPVILDEILPHTDGCSHEIACWDGTLTLVCRDLKATWIETTCSSKP